jgi:hypothetical protein
MLFKVKLSNHRAVEAYANWDDTNLSVTLHWKVENNVESYTIFKRIYGTESWGSSIITLHILSKIIWESP